MSPHLTTQLDREVERLFGSRLLALGHSRRAGDLLLAEARKGPPATPRRRLSRQRGHVAPGHELAFVTTGSAKIVTLYGSFELAPGRLLVIEPGVAHEEAPSDPGREQRVFWCGLLGTLARLSETVYLPSRGYQPGISVLLDGTVDVESIASAIAVELYRREWGWPEAANGLLRYLSRILIRRLRRAAATQERGAESPTVGAETRTWEVVRQVLKFCAENFRRPVRVKDVAAAVGYSPDYLSRLFATHLGLSIADHIRHHRITEAADMLKNTGAAIQEVARAVGYRSPAHFARDFRRRLGVTPTAFRRRFGRH